MGGAKKYITLEKAHALCKAKGWCGAEEKVLRDLEAHFSTTKKIQLTRANVRKLMDINEECESIVDICLPHKDSMKYYNKADVIFDDGCNSWHDLEEGEKKEVVNLIVRTLNTTTWLMRARQ